MPSYAALWIPTIVVAHLIGLALILYALEELNGAVSGLIRLVKWYCGCYKGTDLQKHDSTGSAIAKDELPELSPAAEEERKSRRKRGRRKRREHNKGAQAVDKDSYPMPVELSWYSVICSVNSTGNAHTAKTVLHKSSGTFFPCEAVAIMGPSGAGKSTMLDVLSGRKHGKGVEGRVTLNGQPITPETSNKYISYVGQEDVFMPTLSAWESLLFCTQLCLPAMPVKQRNARMEAVLETMGLLRVKNSKVGGLLPGGVAVRGISGGEKRRLSIACGLVGNPSILFLDEPTTGLDSHAALAVMRYLNTLTDMGHTIVSSIHQPRQEIFGSFDKVMLLSEGYQLFLAPPSYTVRWFSEVLQFPYEKERDGTVADWVIGTIAVGFKKTGDAKARSMSSVEEVKEAAAKYEEFVANLKEAEELAAKEEAAELASMPSGGTTQNGGTATPEQAGLPRRGSTASVMSGSVLSGQSSMADAYLLWAGGQQNSSTLGAQPLKDEPQELAETNTVRLYTRSWGVQWMLLTKRSVMQQLRNPAEAAMRILMSTWSGTVAGLVWIRLPDNGNSAQQRLSLIFFCLMMFTMTPFGYMAFPIADKRFFLLDSAKGLYAPSAYFMAYVTSNAPFFVINSSACWFMTYGLAGLRYEWWAILQSTAIMCLHALVANQGLTMCIWLCTGQDMAFSLATIYISFSLLICGFYIRIQDMTLSIARGLSWASFPKYAFQGLARTELVNRVWDANSCTPVETVPGFGPSPPLCEYPSNDILDYYEYTIPVAVCAAALLSFWAVACILSYYALLKLYKKR